MPKRKRVDNKPVQIGLDFYHSSKLRMGLEAVWNNKQPTKFAHENFHKQAFQTFFEKEMKVEKVNINKDRYGEIAGIQVERKLELMTMCQTMVTALKEIRNNMSCNSQAVKIMAEGIRVLQTKEESRDSS